MLVCNMSFVLPFMPCDLRFFDKTFEHIHLSPSINSFVYSHILCSHCIRAKGLNMPFVPCGLNIP
jgi:hypothetical protein